jgi:predicted dehydrogenase
MEDDPGVKATAAEHAVGPANARVVDDWLAAIREKREPACSGRNAAKAVETVMAVWRAGLSGGRVALPLAERGHALAKQGG